MNKTLLARPQVLNVYTKSVSAGDRDWASGWFVCLSGAKVTLLITHTRYPVLSELWSWLKVAPHEVSESQWPHCLSQRWALLILVHYQFHFLMLTFHRKVKLTRLSKRLSDHPHIVCACCLNILVWFIFILSASVSPIPGMSWESTGILILTIRKVNVQCCTERNQI